ncbi:MAG TPA: DUF5694 domain-containing protein [Nannocystis sp.]|jgi:hypothetical protein
MGALALLGAAVNPALAAQETPQRQRAQVMILGTFHFHNPNSDAAQFKGIDVMSEARQSEIVGVVADLARFQPTRIALEVRIGQGDHAQRLQDEYARYRAGELTLSSNETHQLGFRLASQFGHSAVYPVDYRLGLDIGELMTYATANDPAFATWFQDYIADATRQIDAMQGAETINRNLRWMNEPETLALAQTNYARMASVGANDTYIGARVAAQWYQRNLHIFGNLARIATPGERVLLIVGQGHAPILRQLVRDHPDMELVEPNDYLR